MMCIKRDAPAWKDCPSLADFKDEANLLERLPIGEKIVCEEVKLIDWWAEEYACRYRTVDMNPIFYLEIRHGWCNGRHFEFLKDMRKYAGDEEVDEGDVANVHFNTSLIPT